MRFFDKLPVPALASTPAAAASLVLVCAAAHATAWNVFAPSEMRPGARYRSVQVKLPRQTGADVAPNKSGATVSA